MLDSVKIQRRQSEIRQALAELAGKDTPTEDEVRTMESMDAEYRTNETRYRAALVAEDSERREAGADLETRSEREFSDLVANFEIRQAVRSIYDGQPLSGQTAEAVEELRGSGGYRGIPVPWQALEVRVGETIAANVPAPMQTRPIIDRLFPGSVAAQMGGQLIQIDSGAVEWPVATEAISAGWASTELGDVAGPTVYKTAQKNLQPNHNLGITMFMSRKAMLQSGPALEQAVRRDMAGAMQAELDKAIFQGTGATGQPHGIIAKANATHGITVDSTGAEVAWSVFRSKVVDFMKGNAASGPGDVRLLIHPDVWAYLDDAEAFASTGITEWSRLTGALGSVVMSTNAVAAPSQASPPVTEALMTTSAGGVAPFFVGLWGAVDLIRDPYKDAPSGGLHITALTTADTAVARPAQSRVFTALEIGT